MKIIEADNLKKNFNGFTAVDGVSFHIRQGEIFGFLGPNGAGKTTTINMLTGLAKITAGSVKLLGEDYTRNAKKAQALLGIVPDESNLYEELSGWENLVFCGALYGTSHHLLKQVKQGDGSLASYHPRSLSGFK